MCGASPLACDFDIGLFFAVVKIFFAVGVFVILFSFNLVMSIATGFFVFCFQPGKEFGLLFKICVATMLTVAAYSYPTMIQFTSRTRINLFIT